MKINIYELIYYCFMNDEEAFSALIEAFRPMTVSIIQHRFHTRNRMDYLPLSDCVLYECLQRCRIDRWQFLKSFYSRALENRLIDAIRMEQTHSIQNYYPVFHLDQSVREDIEHYASDLIADPKMHIHEDVMVHIQKDYLYELMDKNFTKEELDILILKQQGYSTHEIAQQYQYSVRKIRYILRKIKKWVQVH
ncbi:MAG: sigma-70 family RNA polymerase sigma factor [Absicoccus porci]|jgi:RNA polymerase sigma factor (sigma-70 family)|uniref:Sigma-70 family RNA polymerase sigma factor n=1 Tax=Absicoccus porci TaxID=2486576 RepID=A0A3N0I373_9FIRM|nr:sigma-70 family RNA polymerase sigma factor [Absicoccus porci]MCI6088271.1 sigma-70 family RNA polymerase sigma factor [Absicoccus porci]MDD6459728.1 sigma-70 family RNA polymerase sigma factor [Absicoccus porci]MDD7330358.1 sigma-70 family RNA polymerase sigma factor [Absicoccus porci]MDY4739200.1 sigma-70 family RNA polymerase sigma factor [Absicoccus porci]MEE1354789.1 sigma-70 family RNA polymerase sigma factor [Absicoccus porci]